MSLLVARPGARFACSGDGLCCSDIHALGPLDRREERRVRAENPDAVVTHARLGLPVLRTGADHRCTFLDEDGCILHRKGGPLAKPGACRGFPFGLTRTPDGLRVTTAHRCPCRTMGARPPVDVDEARVSLRRGGSLPVYYSAPERIALTTGRRVGWTKYRAVEDVLFDALAASGVESVLGPGALGDPEHLPALSDAAWSDVAHAHRARVDGSSTGEAIAWFGDALLAVTEGARLRLRARPWSFAFDRAEQRSARAPSAEADPRRTAFADFAADQVWSMAWSEEGSLGAHLARLRVVFACASRIAQLLEASGVGRERAAAEAVLVGEIALAGPLGFTRFDVGDERAAIGLVMDQAALSGSP